MIERRSVTHSRRTFLVGSAAAAATLGVSAVRAADPPPPSWGCVGDSMTHGVLGAADSIPALMARATGVWFDDYGVIAQTSTEIAARIGATPTHMAIARSTIPASGAVRLTALDPLIVNHTGPDAVIDSKPIQRALLGTLHGVRGLLTRDLRRGLPNQQVPIGAFSFVRLEEGEPVHAHAGSRFVPDTQVTAQALPMIVRMGYNNRADFDQVVADHTALFRWHAADAPLLLLDPPVSYYDDAAAKATSERIAAWLRGRARAMGVHYLSIHGYVASRRGLRDAGIAPSDDDLAAIADRRTPMSATVGDGLHYNAAINRAVAARLVAELRTIGYL